MANQRFLPPYLPGIRTGLISALRPINTIDVETGPSSGPPLRDISQQENIRPSNTPYATPHVFEHRTLTFQRYMHETEHEREQSTILNGRALRALSIRGYVPAGMIDSDQNIRHISLMRTIYSPLDSHPSDMPEIRYGMEQRLGSVTETPQVTDPSLGQRRLASETSTYRTSNLIARIIERYARLNTRNLNGWETRMLNESYRNLFREIINCSYVTSSQLTSVLDEIANWANDGPRLLRTSLAASLEDERTEDSGYDSDNTIRIRHEYEIQDDIEDAFDMEAQSLGLDYLRDCCLCQEAVEEVSRHRKECGHNRCTGCGVLERKSLLGGEMWRCIRMRMTTAQIQFR